MVLALDCMLLGLCCSSVLHIGLAERLREEGLLLDGAALDLEIVNKVEQADVSWLLHK